MTRSQAIFLVSAMLLAVAANGAVLIDPTGGTTLTFTGLDDGIAAGRSIGFTGDLFGASHTTVDVSTNGNVNFSANTAFNNTALPTAITRVSPLWDDKQLDGSSSVIENVDPGVYYAVTWNNVQNFSVPAQRSTFQMLWIGAPTEIGGFSFQTGDFAFSYGAVSTFSGGNATIGLDKGDSLAFAPIPGDADGLILDGDVGLIPTDLRFILFRPDGQGGYDASIEPFIVPEPATLALVGCGIACLLGFQRRRRA